MNEKDRAELRRRFRPDKNNITRVCGCYVNEQKEIVSEFDQSLAMMGEEEAEKTLSILKRTLSGTADKNLLPITFDTRQVVEGQEHALLMSLRESALQDQNAIQTFYQQVIESVTLEDSYLILLAHDNYDVPYRGKDGLLGDGNAVYSYFLCSICPVRRTKSLLRYDTQERALHNQSVEWLVRAPELGFLFPAFDDRCANLYGALFYTKDSAESHPEFIEQIFHQQPPMPADTQKETFSALLSDCFAQDCNLELYQAVQDSMCDLIQRNKEEQPEDPLTVSKDMVKKVLDTCDIPSEAMSTFDERFDSAFGYNTQLSPGNLVSPNKLEVKTPEVTIRLRAEHSGLLETRTIGGVKYILVRADDDVTVNGVPIYIT